MGKIFFHGIDSDGNKVFSLGRGSSKLILPSIQSMLEILNEKGKLEEKIIFSNTSPTVPLAMTLGGLFSKIKNLLYWCTFISNGSEKSPSGSYSISTEYQRGRKSLHSKH